MFHFTVRFKVKLTGLGGVELSFQPGADLVSAMEELRTVVARSLSRLGAGELPDSVERQRIDLKEESGRRGAGGMLLPGTRENIKAADQLADEVACMANTPGGGALIVGVENRSGDLIGTELDQEWLRQQIYRRVDVAPIVEEHQERGIRLLVLLVPEAREPVEDTGNRIRWRVADSCAPVDRASWWLHRQGRVGWDPLARASRKTVDDVSPNALRVARRNLRGRPEDDDLDRASDTDLLRRLGVLDTDGYLSEAGALLFCPTNTPRLTWARFDVQGGEVLASEDENAGLSVLEQIDRVEGLISAANDRISLPGSFSERQVRLLPARAAREAVLNGIVHRDWHQAEPTSVSWVEADSLLEVTSPGGFVGGVTPSNVLTQRFARSPALADAVRALGLVDRQGIGVDRMFREMVSLGHRPPQLEEVDGPRVRVRLRGGQPVVPVVRLMTSIEPIVRQRDVQVALIVYSLLHHPFTTAERISDVLQRSVNEAQEALEVAASCRVESAPLIEPHKDVWRLSDTARHIVLSGETDVAALKRRGVLAFLAPDSASASRLVQSWLEDHERITSGDYAALTGLTTAGARKALERMVDEDILIRGENAGRNAHFLEAP